MSKKQTTESLRATLFDALEKVRLGEMEPKRAREIAMLADRIIQTAEIELRYSEVCSRLDQQGQGINPGRLLLVSGDE